jgi:hypothetical protein
MMPKPVLGTRDDLLCAVESLIAELHALLHNDEPLSERYVAFALLERCKFSRELRRELLLPMLAKWIRKHCRDAASAVCHEIRVFRDTASLRQPAAHACENCGSPLPSVLGKASRRFCSDRCRQAAYRRVRANSRGNGTSDGFRRAGDGR